MAYNPLASAVSITSSFTGTGPTTINPVTLASLPAGTTGVIFNANYTGGHAGSVGARMTGSGDNYYANQTSFGVAGNSAQVQIIAGLNGNNECDVDVSSLSGFGIDILGYFDNRATFVSTAVDLGALNASTYTNYDIYSLAPSSNGAVAAIVTCGSTAGVWGCRMGSNSPGPSSDDFTGNSGWGNGPTYCIVGVDSLGNFAAKSSGQVNHLYLIGWIMSGYTPNVNAVDRTPGTAGSAQALSTSGDTNPIAFLYGMKGTVSTYTYQVGSSGFSGLPGVSVGCSGSNAQMTSGTSPTANISNTALKVFELGYFTAAPPASLPVPPSTLYGLQPLLAQ